jgi:hypothetical protein
MNDPVGDSCVGLHAETPLGAGIKFKFAKYTTAQFTEAPHGGLELGNPHFYAQAQLASATIVSD